VHGRPWFILRRDLAGSQERLPKGRLLSCDLDGYNTASEASHGAISSCPGEYSFTINLNLYLINITFDIKCPLSKTRRHESVSKIGRRKKRLSRKWVRTAKFVFWQAGVCLPVQQRFSYSKKIMLLRT
jgi:hypothetical protein